MTALNAAAKIPTDYFLKSYWKTRRRRRERRNNELDEAHILTGRTRLCCIKRKPLKKNLVRKRRENEAEDPAAETRYVSVNLEAYCRIS